MNVRYIQVVVAGVIVFFLLALGDYLPFWMPNMNEMLVLLVVTLLMLTWAGFVMFEKAVDEREVMLRMHAGRIAYLSGIAVLLLALIVQGFAHAIDPWIMLALGVMVVTKLGARLFFDREE
jgi:hypothetical protein